MVTVSAKKGYDLNLAGVPSTDLEVLAPPSKVGFHPDTIPFIKPRLRVKKGDRVLTGAPLFEDKRNPRVTFPSPGSGRVAAIGYGPRRVVTEIVIELDEQEEPAKQPAFSPENLAAADRQELVDALLDSSLWPLVRALPFRDIPNPAVTPPLVIVSLGSLAPFHPDPQVYLKDREADFEYGLDLLAKLADRVLVTAGGGGTGIDGIDSRITHTIKGDYPADDPATVLYHVKTSPQENRAWYITGQDLLTLSSCLRNGIYPVDKVVAVGGARSTIKKHLLTRAGAPVSDFIGHTDKDGLRLVAGGIFNGYSVSLDSYLGYYETALTLMSAGDPKELFSFVMPGYKKASRSRAFTSVFNPGPMVLECDQNGEDRACINCGYCPRVCPVDILPQFTFKAVEADEIEEALTLGLLDCVECGLCSFVCPSKIEISDILKKAKEAYAKEIA
ncbi:MAG: 4Fe-4S dicluster domain-containing protein [Desulfobacterales bacterium]|nr:4Fe-4S dicluster domain-containing protein [Desulfobacterales bacterium]